MQGAHRTIRQPRILTQHRRSLHGRKRPVRSGMSIEQEDPLYGADNNPGPDFSEDFKMGFVMAKRYLDQYVP